MIKFIQTVSNDKLEKYEITNRGSALSYKHFFMKLKSDINFRSQFINMLTKSRFVSYRLETPPVSLANIDQPFEFVLINSPELNDVQDSTSFDEYMNTSSDNILSFLNLSKKSELIIPNLKSNENVYSHLAHFVRKAPTQQVHDLFKTVASKVQESINSENIWVSTAGAGVDWLHVRIDKKPKYYRYKKYKI